MNDTDPLETARQLRAERRDLDKRVKQADEAAVAHGFAHGMNSAEIAYRIGASSGHVYNVHHRSKGAQQ